LGGWVCAQPPPPSARHGYFPLASKQTQVGSSRLVCTLCENLQLLPMDGMAVKMHLDAGKDLIIRRDVNVWSSPA
jgi:hypothetical protein